MVAPWESAEHDNITDDGHADIVVHQHSHIVDAWNAHIKVFGANDVQRAAFVSHAHGSA